jgi:glycosyltransferase involved in cell wall biosynthesis
MTKKKIISSVTNDLLTDQRVHRICASLAGQGYEVTLIGRRKRTSKPLNTRDYTCRRFRLIFEKGPLFYAEYNLRLFFILLFSKVDVLIANDLDSLPANFLVSRLRRIPIVYDSHEFFTEVPELIERNRTRSVWMKIEKACIKGLSDYLTVSKPIAQAYFKRYGVEMVVIRNLPVSYKIDEINVSPENVIDKNGHKLILYQGSVNVDRGLEEMMSAMEFLSDFKLVICGDGDILQNLNELRAEMEWKDRILLKGSIALEKLPEFTIQADVGISIEKLNGLSYTYALPNKVFDYLQAGLPVLVSSMPEVMELNDQFEFAQVIEIVSPKEIAVGINELFKSDERYAAVKKNAEKAAIALNWSSEEVKLFSVFERILFPTL